MRHFEEPRRDARRPGWLILAVIGATLGLLSGLTGVGGGIFLSPLVLLAGWVDPKQTAAVSVVFILVNSAAGLAGHLASLERVPAEIPWWVLAVVAGGAIGSGLGARRLANSILCMVLAAVLIVAAIKMLVS
jgi:hypothetical protein